MNILYVEDMPLEAELIQRYINKATPHHLNIVSTIEEARVALQEGPDIILMDIVINDAKVGFSFAREIREQGYTNPIIAVTALALPRDIEQCYKAGFTNVLTKPFELKDLAALLVQYAV